MFQRVLFALILIISPVFASELVINGSFETGTFTGWTAATTGEPFLPWQIGPAGQGALGFGMQPTMPQSGMLNAWHGFDGSGPMHFTLYQDIAIPRCSATAAKLSWKDRLQWNFAWTNTATQPRTYTVQVRPTMGSPTTLYSFSTGTDKIIGDTGWQTHSSDLSAFAGSTIRLWFDAFIPEMYTGPAQFEIDAVSMTVTEFVSLDNRCTTIPDRVVDPMTGKTLQQYVNSLADQCTVSARNHGEFVSCMTKGLNEAKGDAISGREKGTLTSLAAQSPRGMKYW
jgi:hypothetical protein